MLYQESNQWKLIILDYVGINKFTDMYVNGIKNFLMYDLTEETNDTEDFDKILDKETLTDMISILMDFVHENEDQLKEVSVTYQILLVRYVIAETIKWNFEQNNIPKFDDVKEIDFYKLKKELVKITKNNWLNQMAFKDFPIREENNIVKKVCKELRISQAELGRQLDVPSSTVGTWASSKIPKMAEVALELMLENKRKDEILQAIKKSHEMVARI